MPVTLSSGAAGVLAIVIGGFTLWALVLAGDRYFYLHRARVDTFELLRGLLNQLRSGHVKEAIANCDAKTGPVGEIFRTAIEHWNDGEVAIRHAVEECGMLLVPRLERNLKLLRAFANFLPIAGFLGTVVALIGAFDKVSGNASFDAKAISGDVTVALSCLAVGLLASLVCQLFHAVLTEKIDHILEEMEKGAAEITYFLTHNPPPAEEDTDNAKK